MHCRNCDSGEDDDEVGVVAVDWRTAEVEEHNYSIGCTGCTDRKSMESARSCARPLYQISKLRLSTPVCAALSVDSSESKYERDKR